MRPKSPCVVAQSIFDHGIGARTYGFASNASCSSKMKFVLVGWRVKSAIEQARLAKPKLILADEPTGNLHSSQGREIMELFKKLNDQGTTIIQVTHSEENAKYGNRIIELKDGWITQT